MSWKRTSPSRAGATLAVLGLAAACAAVLAAPAGAVPSNGAAQIVTADHDRGRTLSGQGGKLRPAAGTWREDGKVTLPAPAFDPSGGIVDRAGNLRFRKGKRGVPLAGIHIDLATRTLSGRLGGSEMAVFKLGAAPIVDPVAGTAVLSEAALRFTPRAAKIVRKKLGLKRALRRDGVGMLWVNVRALPTREAARPVSSGSLDWGVLTGWRSYVLGNFGPGSEGTIATGGGATANGELADAGAYFGFPASGGTFEKGLYGATDRLSLQTAGSVTFDKPGHCIVEVKFADLAVTLDGADSSLVLDSAYDIDSPPGCADNPPVATDGTLFASLDLSGVTAAYAADGKTITWAEIPATLTEAGGAGWGAGYEAGDELDPVTIAVELG
ncbi:MAG: HtaA domain-containing protein [Solirubrobacterales bacterium]